MSLLARKMDETTVDQKEVHFLINTTKDWRGSIRGRKIQHLIMCWKPGGV